jgi:hypothetical protein
MRGDMGVGNFFIANDDLKSKGLLLLYLIMPIINLYIEDIFTLKNGDLVFALAIADFALREEWKERSKAEVKDLLSDKRTKVQGKTINLPLGVLDVIVTSSIVTYKLIFFRVKRNKETEKIQLMDQVSIEI